MNNNELDNISNLVALFKWEKVLAVFIGLFLLSFLVKLFKHIENSLIIRFPNRRLLVLQISTSLTFFVSIFGGIFLIFSVLDPPKELVLALGGSLAVAIGFSIKDLISSFFAGIILLFDRPFQVGDRVSFGDTYGEIVSIGLRAVRLNTLDDNLVTIPNSKFITDVVATGNNGALDMMVEVPFYLAIDSDFVKAQEILLNVIYSSRYAFLKRPVSVVLAEEKLGYHICLKMTAKSYVLDVKFEKAFYTDIITRTERSFLKEKIKRPVFSSQDL